MAKSLASSDVVPLARASEILRISPKTLQKRLNDLSIRPVTDPHDKRVRLLTSEQIKKVQESTRKNTRIEDRVKSLARTLQGISRRLRGIEDVIPRHRSKLTSLEKQLAEAVDRIGVLEEMVRNAGHELTQPTSETGRSHQHVPAPQTVGDHHRDREPVSVR